MKQPSHYNDTPETVCNVLCTHLEELLNIIQFCNRSNQFSELEDIMRHHAYDVIDWARIHNLKQANTPNNCDQVDALRLGIIETMLESEMTYPITSTQKEKSYTSSTSS